MAKDKTVSVIERNHRPAGMPYDPSASQTTAFMVPLTERTHVLIEAIQNKLRSSPAIVELGANVTKASAARSIIEAGIRSLAAQHGVDVDAELSKAQAEFDGWLASDDNAAAAKAYRAAQG